MMRGAVVLLLVLALLGASTVALSLTAAPARAASPDASSRVTANITGPTVLAVSSNQRYLILAGGGPAIAPNGTEVGNLTYYAGVSAANLTGVTITPASAAILNGTPGNPLLEAGPNAQTVTINVEISSVYNTTNVSVNLTYTVQVVQPYIVSAVLVNDNSAIVESLPVLITLDGTQIGNVTVPAIQPYADYNFSFSYATLGLSSGYHTFLLSLPSQHGLVRFEGGSTSYSETVYVPGPAPDNTLWYVTGVVAFLGVLFILGSRLGARRRSPSKK